jgi:hypothetical protein
MGGGTTRRQVDVLRLLVAAGASVNIADANADVRRQGGVTHTAPSKCHDENYFISVYPYKIWRAHSDHGFSVRHTKSTLFDPP